MRFSGKRAVVTGGASGIGRATALRLAAEGAEVLIGDVDEAGARAVAAEDGFGRIRARACDVSRDDDLAALMRQADGEGGLDLLSSYLCSEGSGYRYLAVVVAGFWQPAGVSLPLLPLSLEPARGSSR